jgi:hypothetical protein
MICPTLPPTRWHGDRLSVLRAGHVDGGAGAPRHSAVQGRHSEWSIRQSWQVIDDAAVAVDITSAEHDVLRAGLVESMGPASCTEELALAIGFGGFAAMFADMGRLIRAIDGDQPLTAGTGPEHTSSHRVRLH